MNDILIIKTAALGDVLRTTSILPGLHRKYARASVTWLTAANAVELIATHPLVARVEPVDCESEASLDRAARALARTSWRRVISLDDEDALCRLASGLRTEQLSGAHVAADGARAYTRDVAPWFDMGLLSVHGKAEADRLKVANQKSQPAIYAEMLGIEMGKPALHLTDEARAFGERFAREAGLRAHGPVVGLNTGAGGRWLSKQLSIERTVALARAVDTALAGRVEFLVLGGALEAERNREIVHELGRAGLARRTVDAGTDRTLSQFAGLVSLCDLVVSSDSLCLHVAVARDVPVVAFFAPTSAAEIELYGRGEKVSSTSPDYCSYRPDADNSSITPERLTAAVLRELAAHVPTARRCQ